MSKPSANDLYRAIQVLVRQGQPVFPCKPAGEKAKAPLTKNGVHDATLDLAQIKRWWKAKGDSAIGIPTGFLWDVLDVDIKDGADGRAHLSYLQSVGLLRGCQRVVRTPGGGLHLYFTASPILTNKGRAASLGLDVRAKGGYVLAPPSYIDTPEYAGCYVDEGPCENFTDDPIYWDAIQNALAPRDSITNKEIEVLPGNRHSLAALRNWVANVKEGERNNGLHWAVHRCIEAGLDPHELMEPALDAGLGEEEILKTIGSALQRAGVALKDLSSEAEMLFPDPE